MIITKKPQPIVLELGQRYNYIKIDKFCEQNTTDDSFCDYKYSVPISWSGKDLRNSYDFPIFETLLLIEKDQSIITLLKVDDGMYMVVNIYDEDNNFNL